ncbi:MAG: ATP-binding protein [Burkholderiales bacterium]
MRLWPQSLRAQVVTIVLLATFIALTVATAALVLYDTHAYREALTADLATQAEILGRSTAPALAFDDPQAAQENLALMQSRPDILLAAVYRAGGDVFAIYRRPGIDVAVPARSGEGGARVEGETMTLVRPIVEKGETLGMVVLRARYEARGRLTSYVVILIAVMAASLVVAVLASVLLQRRITRPILAVSDVAREVMTRRDFSLRAARTQSQETDVLVDAFNAMLAEIGRQADALAQSNRSLQSEMVERRAVEDALRTADQNKDRFLATLAHELRNPLAPLVNGLALLRMPPQPGLDPQEVLATMDRQLRQMVRLIDDLLDVSRIATDKLVLRRAVVDLRTAVSSALETVGPFLAQAGHRVDVQLPAEPMPVDGDVTRLAQVFANLLHNAGKFTPAGGRIAVRMRRDGARIVATVTDNGVGIAPAMRERVFDLFEQADTSLERTQSGLGVGLSLARRLLELHGGTLTARSEGAGQGSEFEVALPAAAVAALPAARPDTTAMPGQRAAAGRRILIVDDNRDFATTLAAILGSHGYDVRVANDGDEGLRTAAAFTPDVAFVDIGMPKRNGYDLAAEIRRSPGLAGAYLVAVTGWGQEKDRERARDAGFDRHLMKPVEPRDILAIVESRPA